MPHATKPDASCQSPDSSCLTHLTTLTSACRLPALCMLPLCPMSAFSLSPICSPACMKPEFPMRISAYPHAPSPPPACLCIERKIPRMTLASFFFFCTVWALPGPVGISSVGRSQRRGGGEAAGGPTNSSPSSLLQAVCLPGFTVPAGASSYIIFPKALTLFFLQRYELFKFRRW
jgi:hypothetical protein